MDYYYVFSISTIVHHFATWQLTLSLNENPYFYIWFRVKTQLLILKLFLLLQILSKLLKSYNGPKFETPYIPIILMQSF